jgi:4-amino-4-deoxy-L-arabinose transferase-like glycosyltransferase
MRNNTTEPRRGYVDGAIFALLAVTYCIWLISTTRDLGYARDEGFYFQAADSYADWFKLLWNNPSDALQRKTIDRFWRVNSEHPALVKSLFAVSKLVLGERFKVFSELGTSYRFVGMLFASSTVGVIYLWSVRFLWTHGALLARTGGVTAALGFALMPQVFYHAHLDCFDMPVTAMGLFTTYAYVRALETRTWRWATWTAILYGLMLNTKHNAWLVPFALIGHYLWVHGGQFLLDLKRKRLNIPAVLVLMATLGPLVMWSLWPWMWHDPVRRFRDYVLFHTQHVYYNMEFLGRTYFQPPFPRAYAWVMTLGTVPAITLALFALGVFVYVKSEISSRLLPWLINVRSAGFWRSLEDEPPMPEAHRQRQSTLGFWLMCIGVHYAPWWFTSTPIFGGPKHWMTAYPYMALFAGYAFVLVCQRLSAAVSSVWGRRLVPVALSASVLVGPLVMTVQSHPWGLAAYTPLVGGASGAATLGLNRSFWGYTTGSLEAELNDKAKRGAKVFVHDTAMQAWHMFVQDGRIRRDLRPQLGVAGSEFGIYHHEQHMAQVEHMLWTDYGTVTPIHVATYDGVPIVWLYRRSK